MRYGFPPFMKKFSSSPNDLFMFRDYKVILDELRPWAREALTVAMLKPIDKAHSTRRTRYEECDKRTDSLHLCYSGSNERRTHAVVAEPPFGISNPLVPLQGGTLGTPGPLLRTAPWLFPSDVCRPIRAAMPPIGSAVPSARTDDVPDPDRRSVGSSAYVGPVEAIRQRAFPSARSAVQETPDISR